MLCAINDIEQSSAIGASAVFKYFIQIKGNELFHAIPEFVKESLQVSVLHIHLCVHTSNYTFIYRLPQLVHVVELEQVY